MKPEELQHGAQVEARFSRRDNEDGTAPEWSDWETVTLYVRRRDKAMFPNRPQYNRRKHHDKGAIIELAVKDTWATYVEDDYVDGTWLAEEWRMQLRGA